MTRTFVQSLTAAAVLVAAAVFAPHAVAQAAPDPVHVLDVPFLPQSEALCGGAAAAMVMRYWGAAGVYAETFKDLVVDAEQGIRGDDLLRALRDRGWEARSFRGDAALVRSQLASRRPVVALVEDRPGRFHYVVVVAWANGRVIAHDPARAPFRVLDEAAFDAAWNASGYWTMLALPGSGAPEAERAQPESPGASDVPCAGMVDEGVRLAGIGDLAGARRVLDAAALACPDSPAPWRERAGLHALGERWGDAAADARRALERDPADQHASRILATSLFIEGLPDDALGAWNAIGEPVVDLVEIKGLERTRYAVVMSALGLTPQQTLTVGALQAARRRLAELPAAQASRVSYRPGQNGRATVDAVVLERPLAPRSVPALAGMGLRLLTDRELRVDVASPTGGGELWTARWRWWESRPRLSLEFRTPAPFGGYWGVEAFGEREAFALPEGLVEETRRGARLSVSDWTQAGLRWDLHAAVDRFAGDRTAGALGVALERRSRDDRAAVRGSVAGWAGTARAWSASAGADWRSSARQEGQVLLGRAGVEATGAGAPLALWSGAGAGHGRRAWLRAHPLLDDGAIAGGVFGPRLVHAGGEWRIWRQLRRKPIRFAPALFVDTAKAGGVLPGFDGRWHVDAGAGLRIAVPGAGVVRIDLARGLRDGEMALSVGWTR